MSRFSQSAFTLIEIIVVVGVTTMLLSVVVLTLRRGTAEQAVRREAQRLVLDIRRAQALAASSVEFQGTVPHGYGIVVSDVLPDNTHTVLFVDLGPFDDMTYDPATEFVERRAFENGVSASDAEVFSCSDPACSLAVPPSVVTPADQIALFFCPPNPNTFLYDQSSGSGSRGFGCRAEGSDPFAAARIRLSRGGSWRTVTVNAVGAVFIEE